MNDQVGSKSIINPFSALSVLAVLALILAACAPATTPVATQPAAATAAPTQPAASTSSVTIDVASDPSLGKILVDGRGMTLYIFTKDAADQSNCDATCLENWPPLVSSGTPKLGPGVDASLIGSASLSNGQKIITYNHMPLYYFVKDTQPGQISGQNVGSVWYVISPDGKPVEAASSGTATPSIEASETALNVATSDALGEYLVDGKGMTLYIFTKDGPDQSNCDASCLAKWPALLTQGSPALGPGIDDSLVGSASLADGTFIVTYNHMPLYTWVKDTKPGDTTGLGVGSVWYMISPDGKLIESASTTSPTTTPSSQISEPTINVASDPTRGQILVDGKGMTLYIFTKDGPDQSNCNAACLANWPPLLTQGHPNLGPGADDSLIGTAKLADGRTIVTYNHLPLYYFIKDTKPGDIAGQGVGGVWFVVSPDGEIINQ